MAGNRGVNYGSTSSRVPDIGFSGGGSVYEQREIEALSNNVSQIILSINNASASLERSSKLIATPKDSQALREKIEKTIMEIKESVLKATADIRHLKNITKRSGRQQKLQVQKITDTFEDSIKLCTPVEHQVVAKMRTHMLPMELAVQEQYQSQEGFSDDRITTSEMRQTIENLEFEQGMLLEREQRMNKIAEGIVDINQIMKELGANVYQQAQDIDMIENAIEDVRENVQGAHDELEKATNYQTRRRKNTCMLFFIFILIAIVIALMIAITIHY